MKLGIIADDFTGASDIGMVLAEGGMDTTMLVGVPDGEAPQADAGVIALKSRTIPAEQAIAQSLDALDWLLKAGVEQVVFKICSTFDSTDAGNIGPVLDALADRLGAGPVIVCPAYPEAERRVYMGHLFVGDKLLSETGMAKHPLTPMTDSDLRRVLARQSRRSVEHLRLGAALPDTDAHLIADALSDADLLHLGALAKDHRLLCGGSGIAFGLPGNFGAHAAQPAWQPVKGHGVVLAGSCSEATRGQVAAFKGPRREVSPEDVLSGRVTADKLADWGITQDAPMIFTSADPEKVAAAQSRHGRDKLANTIETLFAQTASALVDRGTKRIVVAGGETSGAVISGLGLRQMQIGPRIAAGVPAMASNGLALALKSGNFGGPDVFAEALSLLGPS